MQIPRPLFIGYKAWKEEEYLLNRMSLQDLQRAYITYPGIQIYIVLLVVSLGASLALMPAYGLGAFARFFMAIGASVVLYPAIWYILHRFVLHNPLMYKLPFTAAMWKRTHYDHHRFPNDLSVLFGGLQTTLPTILILTGPIGWAIGGISGSLASISAALLMTCIYEFWHCGQHLAFEPKSEFWKHIKKLHLAHHYHNEKGNFGITNFFVDRLMGTRYEEHSDVPRSATARNLGYTDEVAKKYPWVKELTDVDGKTGQGLKSKTI